MNNFQVTKQLILDAVTVAEAIEAQFGMYLLPPQPGVYLPTSAQPVMKPNHTYYQIRRAAPGGVSMMEPVKTVADIKGTVYDEDACVVVPAPLVKLISLEPVMPVRGLAIVFSAVDQTLRECAAWAKREVGSVGAFLADHLKEEYRQCLPENEADEEIVRRKRHAQELQRLQRNTELRHHLVDLLTDIRHDVRQFVGDDKWVMHFHYARGRDITVEKTVDFRIFDWERRMASGEWK